MVQTSCVALGAAGAAFTPGLSLACNADGNTVTPCCLADFNKNGFVNVQDVFDYLNEWLNSNPLCKLDGSTTPLTVQDAFNFLNVWFAGGC